MDYDGGEAFWIPYVGHWSSESSASSNVLHKATDQRLTTGSYRRGWSSQRIITNGNRYRRQIVLYGLWIADQIHLWHEYEHISSTMSVFPWLKWGIGHMHWITEWRLASRYVFLVIFCFYLSMFFMFLCFYVKKNKCHVADSVKEWMFAENPIESNRIKITNQAVHVQSA